MKILIYSPYSLESNNLPILLDEAMEYLQNRNNEVLFVTCGGEIKLCDSNYEQSPIRCKECVFSSNLLIKKIKHPNFVHKKLSTFINIETSNRIKSIEFKFNSINEIKCIHHQGVNIGLGVVSSYVSMTRNLNPTINKTTRVFFNNALRSSALLVETIFKIADIFQPDLLCLFNGRYSGLRPVMEAGKKLKINITTLECTFSSSRENQRKVKFFNNLPHEIDNNKILIEDNWNSYNGKDDKETVAANFYEKRRKAEIASDDVYIHLQDHSCLPSNWDENKRNYAIFSSSEDEFFCIGDCFDKYKLFENQIEAVQYLVKKTENDPSIHYYLRIHPNLQNVKFSYVTSLVSLFEKYSNITVIPPSSPISTYKLMDCCEKVFVFGSTVGVEAAYWGKPVILLGGAFYFHLNVAYYPKNIMELNSLLYKTLAPKPRLGALKYALYIFGERGSTYKYCNYNYKIIKIGRKTLSLPLCFGYKGSMIPYIFVVIFFRTLNILPHLIFKKITMQKLSVEKPLDCTPPIEQNMLE